MSSLAKISSVFAILATTAAAVWLHFHFPDQLVATHFGADGVANGFMPRDKAFGFAPATLVVLTALMWILPHLMPKNARLERSQVAYDTIWVAVVLLLVAIDGLIIATALGHSIDMPTAVCLMVGALYIIMGNVLPKFRYNYVAGIRTYWTLSDERIWDRTHRFSGPVFMLSGIALIATPFVVGADYFMHALIALSTLPAVISIVASYMYARKL